MNTNAESHPAIFRNVLRGRVERALHGQRRSDRTRRGVEHREHRVAGHVDDVTVIGLDLRLEDVTGGIQCSRRGALIGFHETRIADGVGGQYRRKSLSWNALAHRIWDLIQTST